MKQRTKKKWRRSLALALSFAMLLPMAANLSVGAAGEGSTSSGSAENKTVGSSGTWTPNYDRKPQNTKGDLTVDQLKTKQLDKKDIPEVVGEKTAREKDHAHRLYQQEEDMNTVIFQNRDGTKTMYYFAEPVKYKDETGKIKDKSNALTQRPDGSTENAQNDVKTRFPKDLSKDSGVTLSYQGRQITLSPAAGMGTARRLTYPKTDESLTDAVSYQSVFGEGTSLRYTPTFEGFKEDIILDRYTGQSRFSFRLQTGGLTLVNEKGALSLCDPLTGKTVADIGELIVYDSTGDMSAVIEGKYTHKYEVRTVKQDSEYILTMSVDEAYLQAETTVYPVYVDPSFHVYSVTNGQKTIQDATIYTGYSQKEGSLYWIYAGAYPGRGTARALVKFPGLVYTDPFMSLNDSQITSVKYMVYNTNPQYIEPSTINAYMLTRGWSEPDVKYDSLLWDAAGQQLDSKNLTTDGTSSSGTGTGDWYGFNITSAALQWKNQTAANHGIMLRDTVESKYVKAFYSSDSVGSPHVEVEYSQYISTPAPGVESGDVYYLQNFNSYLYMDVYNGGTENGTSLLQNPFQGGLNQQMQLIRDSATGYYKIAPMNAPDKVLTIGDYGFIVLGEDCSLNSQLWRIEVDCDTYYFISRTDEMSYLSVNNHGEGIGSSLVILPRGASSAWRLVYASTTYGNFSKDLSSPTQPQYITNNLSEINNEYDVWPAGSISRYHQFSTQWRIDSLMSIQASALATALGGWLLQEPDAAGLLKHFLDNNGNQKTISFKKMNNEGNNAINNRKSDINATLEAAENLAVNGSSVTFCSVEEVRHESNGGAASSGNWLHAIGKYSTKIKCVVTKTGNQYTATIYYYLYDVYDWDRTITSMGNLPVSPQDMWELQYGGLAKGFLVTGTNILNISWTQGQRYDTGASVTDVS